MHTPGKKLLALFLALLAGTLILVATHWTTSRMLHQELDDDLLHLSNHVHAHLEGVLEGLLVPPRILGQMHEVRTLLTAPTQEKTQVINLFLEQFAKESRGETVYLLDPTGTCIASSNWRSDKSFVGEKYAFRPYFRQAMAGGDGFYVAQGVTSGTIGLYLSRPVLDPAGSILGVAVVKYPASILLERFMEKSSRETYLMVEDNGIVFSATLPGWQARPLLPLAPTERQRLDTMRIYSDQVLSTPGLLPDPSHLTVVDKREFASWPPSETSPPHAQRVLFTPVNGVPGWQLGVALPDRINPSDMFAHFLVNTLLALAVYVALLLLAAFLWARRIHLARMNVLMRHIPVAMAMFDRHMNYLHASHRWLDDHNLDPHATLGRNHYQLLPHPSERWKEIHRKALDGQWQRRDAEPFLLPDGETQWTTWEAFPMRNPRGRVEGIILYTLDVTPQVTMQNEINVQRNKLAYEREFIERIILKMRNNKGFAPGILRYLLSPVEKTAGDILLAAPRPDGVRHTLLGDFTGHGLTAALAGPLVADIFYSMTSKGLTLQDILGEINIKLYQKLPTGLFMTVCCVEHPPAPGTARVWNWNMPEVLHCRAGNLVQRVTSHHFASGIVAQTHTTGWTELELRPGDRLYLVSDGVVELKNREGERLGQERLNRMLVTFSAQNLPLEELAAAFTAFRQDPLQADDLSMVEIPC